VPQTLFVIVPFYNEASGISATLEALAGQTDPDFNLVLVDNGSTDGTADIVAAFAQAHNEMRIGIIDEPVKGTGAAADTGFRHAIGMGAKRLARTDADCLPRSDWIAAVCRAFDDGLEMVAGDIVARTDDYPPRLWERWLLPAVVRAAATFGRYRPSNRGPEYRCPYIMCAGNNLGITAALYDRCGGFPRSSIEEIHEDRALVNRARRHTNRIGRRRDVVVANSVRRLRAYGLPQTLLWYWDHRAQSEVVDVR
jgi:glycosyltransferase involved in cell wall biosynthesis